MHASFREARSADAEGLSVVAQAAKSHWGYPPEWLELWRGSLTISPEFIADNPVWVAEADDMAVAFVALTLAAPDAEIEHLWVMPDYMGQGLGAELLGIARRFCRRQRVTSLRIESDPHAQAFYEKMGAHQVGMVASIPAPRRLPVLLLEP